MAIYISCLIAVNYDDEGDVGDVNDDGDNNDNIYTDDQEALDCLDRDGEAESDEENGVDESSHHLKSIRQHSFQIGGVCQILNQKQIQITI